MTIKNLIPPLFKALGRYRNDRSWYDRINELGITKSYLEEGLAVIELDDGHKFYGYPSDKVQHRIYRFLLPNSNKSNLIPECLNLAFDVIKRYWPYPSVEEEFGYNRFIDLKEGQAILEGGAFLGLYAIKAAEQVGVNGKVLAIEAIPENFEVIKKNISANGLNNIIVLNNAIWSEPKDLKMYRRAKQIASFTDDVVKDSTAIHTVKALPIDTILEQHGINKIDYVRLQINGAELHGLQGMERTLESKPKLMVAAPYTVNGVNMKERINEFLLSKGYRTEYKGVSVYAYP